MPLTDVQAKLAKLLSENRSNESHLAGGAALHIAPNSIKFSKDLDYQIHFGRPGGVLPLLS